MASQGYGLVITVGFLYAPSTGAAGAKFPDVKFGDVDGFIDHTTCDTCQDESTTGNVTSLLFAENEGAYLVGAAAALKSQSHHIGFIGGVDIALIQDQRESLKGMKEAVTRRIELLQQIPRRFGKPFFEVLR